MHFLIIIIEINIFQSSTGTHLSEVFNRKSCLHVLFRNFFIALFIIRLRIFHLYAHIRSHTSIIVQNSKFCEQMKTEVTRRPSCMSTSCMCVHAVCLQWTWNWISFVPVQSWHKTPYYNCSDTFRTLTTNIQDNSATCFCLSLCSKESAHTFS